MWKLQKGQRKTEYQLSSSFNLGNDNNKSLPVRTHLPRLAKSSTYWQMQPLSYYFPLNYWAKSKQQ